VIKHCPRCGARNAGREPLCDNCGQKLYGLFTAGAPRPTCVRCGVANPGRPAYCVGCGRAFEEGASAPMPAVPREPVAAPRSRVASARPPPAAIRPPTTRRGESGCVAAATAVAVFLAAALLLARPTQPQFGTLSGGSALTSRAAEPATPPAAAAEPTTAAAPERASDDLGYAVVADAPTPVLRATADGAEPSPDNAGRTPPRGSDPAESGPAASLTPTVAASATPTVAAYVGPAGPPPSIRFSLSRVAALAVPASEHRLISTTATIEAVSPEPAAYDAATVRLTDSMGAAYSPLPGTAGHLPAGVLGHGEQTTLELLFEVPADASGFHLSYQGAEVDLSGVLAPAIRPSPPPSATP
jgi:hypothetical protein